MALKKETRKDTGRHRSIRFDPWIHDEMESLAKSRNVPFTDVVNHLLEYQLNLLGFSRAKYEARSLNLIRPENLKNDIKIDNLQIENTNEKIGDVSVNTGNMEVKKNGGI